MTSNFFQDSLKPFIRFSKGLACLWDEFGFALIASTMVARGWVGGSDSILTVALWVALGRVSSMGRSPAWASRKSVGLVQRAPTIASEAICWTFCSWHNTPAEPEFLVWPASLVGWGGGGYTRCRGHKWFLGGRLRCRAAAWVSCWSWKMV